MNARNPLILPALIIAGLSFATSRPAAAASDQGTLTSVVFNSTCGSLGQYAITTTGYNQGGSYAPALTGGETVTGLYNLTGEHGPVCPQLGAYIWISGFSSDPGLYWLSSVTCNGTTLTVPAGGQYAYNAGTHVAEWIWRKSYWNIGTGTYSCTITHN